MSRIFWDTNLFIYLVEDYGDLSEKVVALSERMAARGDRLHTSTMTLAEVLVKPVQQGDDRLRALYEEIIAQEAVLLSFDREAAGHYARIRGDRTIAAPDAIQLACAATASIDLFITNDARLSQKIVPGVQFLASLDQAYI